MLPLCALNGRGVSYVLPPCSAASAALLRHSCCATRPAPRRGSQLYLRQELVAPCIDGASTVQYGTVPHGTRTVRVSTPKQVSKKQVSLMSHAGCSVRRVCARALRGNGGNAPKRPTLAYRSATQPKQPNSPSPLPRRSRRSVREGARSVEASWAARRTAARGSGASKDC